MDLEVVVEVTDLSRSAVQRLQREINKASGPVATE